MTNTKANLGGTSVEDAHNLKTARRWISHRGGPFLIHKEKECDSKAMGCHNSDENLIEQGFFPCPKCHK